MKGLSQIDKMKLLNNAYRGATCYIISCGPSINDYHPNLIKQIAGHNLVFTIKQTYKTFGDITDFHLFNFCSLENYSYEQYPNVISVYMSQLETFDCKLDLHFYLLKSFQLNKYRSIKYPPLSVTSDFEQYTFDKTLNRPEGPSIMYEIAIYLAIHLGVSEIITMGWDVNYEMPKTIKTPNNKITDVIKNSHYYGSNEHTRRNIVKIVNENKFIIESSKYLNKWLYGRGICLYIISKLSKLDSSIPRLNSDQLYTETINMNLNPNKIKATDKYKANGFIFQPRVNESILNKIIDDK
jgi:hypothetical protein